MLSYMLKGVILMNTEQSLVEVFHKLGNTIAMLKKLERTVQGLQQDVADLYSRDDFKYKHKLLIADEVQRVDFTVGLVVGEVKKLYGTLPTNRRAE